MYAVLDTSKERIIACSYTELGQIAVQLDVVRDKLNSVDGNVAGRIHTIGLQAQNEAVAHSNGDKQKAHDDALRTFLAHAREVEMGAEAASEDGTVPSPLGAAIRKIKAGLERDADLTVESTTSRVEKANSKAGKLKDKAEKDKAWREECIRKGLDPDATGPQDTGLGAGGGEGGELSPMEAALAAMLPELKELNEVDPDHVADMLAGFAGRVHAALKSKVGERMQA